jgi:hypothetical protein
MLKDKNQRSAKSEGGQCKEMKSFRKERVLILFTKKIEEGGALSPFSFFSNREFSSEIKITL